jgi:hypothetical protein
MTTGEINMYELSLNRREQAHKALGHWHFDPDCQADSCMLLPRQLSPDLCQRLIELGQQHWHTRTAFTSSLYTGSHHDPEILRDKQEIAETFRDKPIDLHQEWFNIVYLESAMDSDSLQQVQQQLDIKILDETAPHALKPNRSALRLAVQRSGCVTLNHIDHVYHHSPERPCRYDDPGERKIVVFLQDHVPGQYFNIGNHNLHPWQAGQCVTWNWGVPHHAANFSCVDRYNLMISIDAKQNSHLGYHTCK